MTETPDIPKKPRRWLYPVLFLSLALNLLVAGMIVGRIASPDGPRRADFGAARGLVGEPFLRALPEGHRHELMREVIHQSASLRESREALRGRFQAFVAALRADPYDPDAVAALLAEQRQAALRRNDLGETLLLARLHAMNSAEREAYADALERSFRRLKRQED